MYLVGTAKQTVTYCIVHCGITMHNRFLGCSFGEVRWLNIYLFDRNLRVLTMLPLSYTVCMYRCMNVYVLVLIVCKLVHMYACVYVYVCMYLCVYVHISCLHTCICMFVCVRTYVHMYIHVCVYVVHVTIVRPSI